MSSQRTDKMSLLRKIAELETAQKIEQVEQMVRDLQATLEKKDQEQKMKDLEQKMERMQAQAQVTSDKKDLEHKMERMQMHAQAENEKRDREADKKEAHHQMQNEKRDRLFEKKELEQKMERMHAQAQVTSDKKDLEQKMEKANIIMRLENEKRDRLHENDKKEAQHQIEQLKWEARFSRMEQQQAARSYKLEPLANPLQYAAGTVLPHAPQRERLVQIQPTQLQELRLQEKETGPSHSMTPAAATQQPVPPNSTAISAAVPSVVLSSAARPMWISGGREFRK
jgi:hypothetical protein